MQQQDSGSAGAALKKITLEEVQTEPWKNGRYGLVSGIEYPADSKGVWRANQSWVK
ncbi:MAG: hypothetical protein JSU77_12495 [Fidelibacterota bacterium]|nr:MAG: hypothetical protein JSU77_12495 [Candidatus Neomarinimicrobiota bacterium]